AYVYSTSVVLADITVTAHTHTYPPSLHDALPIFWSQQADTWPSRPIHMVVPFPPGSSPDTLARMIADPLSEKLGQTIVIENKPRSEEHTSELQSRENLVCRLLLEKKKTNESLKK